VLAQQSLIILLLNNNIIKEFFKNLITIN
jgi:hypothetical protein